jgi:hypothetical protein
MGEGGETDKWALAASEREGDEALTGGARVSAGGRHARSWAAQAGERGGECGRAGLGRNSAQPREGGVSFFFSFSNSNSFLLLFLFLFLLLWRPKIFSK